MIAGFVGRHSLICFCLCSAVLRHCCWVLMQQVHSERWLDWATGRWLLFPGRLFVLACSLAIRLFVGSIERPLVVVLSVCSLAVLLLVGLIELPLVVVLDCSSAVRFFYPPAVSSFSFFGWLFYLGHSFGCWVDRSAVGCCLLMVVCPGVFCGRPFVFWVVRTVVGCCFWIWFDPWPFRWLLDFLIGWIIRPDVRSTLAVDPPINRFLLLLDCFVGPRSSAESAVVFSVLGWTCCCIFGPAWCQLEPAVVF